MGLLDQSPWRAARQAILDAPLVSQQQSFTPIQQQFTAVDQGPQYTPGGMINYEPTNSAEQALADEAARNEPSGWEKAATAGIGGLGALATLGAVDDFLLGGAGSAAVKGALGYVADETGLSDLASSAASALKNALGFGPEAIEAGYALNPYANVGEGFAGVGGGSALPTPSTLNTPAHLLHGYAPAQTVAALTAGAAPGTAGFMGSTAGQALGGYGAFAPTAPAAGAAGSGTLASMMPVLGPAAVFAVPAIAAALMGDGFSRPPTQDQLDIVHDTATPTPERMGKLNDEEVIGLLSMAPHQQTNPGTIHEVVAELERREIPYEDPFQISNQGRM